MCFPVVAKLSSIVAACCCQDKTFGLKNKKGGKNQKFIAQVEKQVKSGGDPKARRIEEERRLEKQKKEEEKKKQEEEKRLMAKPVVTQKIAQGAVTSFLLIYYTQWKTWANNCRVFALCRPTI